MRSQTAIITAPSFPQGAQSHTLGNGCARLGLTQPTYPTPKEHTPAPSAANTHASHSLNPPSPRPGNTIPHPQQRMRASTDLIAATACAEGAQHRTLGGRYPANHPSNPSCPMPRERNTAPSAADILQITRQTHAIPRPGNTTLHPRRQKPAVAQRAPRVSPALPHPPAHAKAPRLQEQTRGLGQCG